MGNPSEIVTSEGDDGASEGTNEEASAGGDPTCPDTAQGPINDCPVSNESVIDEGVTSGHDGIINEPVSPN